MLKTQFRFLKFSVFCLSIVMLIFGCATDDDDSNEIDYRIAGNIPITWTTKTPMPAARTRMGTCVVNEKIYVIGGDRGPGGATVGVVEVYDPVTDMWTTKTSMPTGRKGLSVEAVNNKIYAIGGNQKRGEVEEYDPAADTWIEKTPMPSGRDFHSSCVLNNKIYIIGGWGSGDQAGLNVGTVEVYDPETDSWETKSPMPTPQGGLPVATVGGIIYAMGGWGNNEINTVEAYDPVTDVWTTKESMPTPQSSSGVAVVNDMIYVIGGYSVQVYDPSIDAWDSGTSLPTTRASLGVEVINDKIYAIGGATCCNDDAVNLATVEEGILY